MPRSASIALLLAALSLSGCDLLGVESPEKIAAARDADGRAIGGACRHAARAIEDCYGMNKKADKAAVFAGWRDMNDYMRENKIEPVTPQSNTQLANAAGGTDADPGLAQPADRRKTASGAAKDGVRDGKSTGKAHDS